ncbi:MAG: DUF2142 domain-containing protein [Myxococcota bacterium]|nr:DUF2142 domain-containing protein [Myxococcota bacterium]
MSRSAESPAGQRAIWRPERVFLLLALGFGSALALLSPPLTAPDEGRHLARVYLLSEGELAIPRAADGASIPRSLVKLFRRVGQIWPQQEAGERLGPAVLLNLMRLPLDPDERAPVRNLARYGPTAYASQALGVAIARQLGLSAAGVVYAGRIGNLLLWSVLVACAIRLTPMRRWALCLLGLMPMHLYLAASLSADSSTSGLAVLFVALVLRAGFGPEARVRHLELIGLCAIAAMLSLTKLGYWAVVASALVIPVDRFGTRRRQLAALTALAACAVLPSSLWWLHTQGSSLGVPTEGVDPRAQVLHVLSDPLGFLGLLAATLQALATVYLRTFVGVLGRLDVVLPLWALVAYGGGLLASAALDGPDPEGLTPVHRAFLLALFAGSIGLLFGVVYALWNPAGAYAIEGVQGRYFIPLAPLLLVAIPGRPVALTERTRALACSALSAGILALALRASWLRYFTA